MITSFPFRMADAPALAAAKDDPSLIRLVVEFDTLSNAADDEDPRWVRDGSTYVLAATFTRAPTALELEAAIRAACVAFPQDGDGARYTCLGYETVQGEELCAYEREQVDHARSIPEYFRDEDIIYGLSGSEVLAGIHPEAWSPAAFARALLAARKEGLKAQMAEIIA